MTAPDPAVRRLVGPPHAHLDAPCADACYEPAGEEAARAGDVIEHGQPIPGNVVALRDAFPQMWVRGGAGYVITLDGDPIGPGRSADELRDLFPSRWPMRVVEVDPEPQPAEPAAPAASIRGKLLDLADMVKTLANHATSAPQTGRAARRVLDELLAETLTLELKGPPMTTETDTATCGETMTDTLGVHVCNRAPHDDEFHSDGSGTSWRVRPDVDPMDRLPHLLWSNRYEMWWKPNRAGYTTDVWAAGRYTRAEALAEARCDMHETPPSIVAVPAPEAGYDALTVEVLAGVGDVMRRRVKAATQAVIEARGLAA